MRLGLSSAAAPDADFGALVHACRQRGLAALELRECDEHGVPFTTVAAGVAAGSADLIHGLYADASSDAARLAGTSTALRAPIVVGDDGDAAQRIRLARDIVARGGAALPLMRGPAREWLDSVTASGAPWAWEIDPSHTDVARDAELVLHDAEQRLAYIRFIGGGPEAALQDGRGVGAVMGRLALAGFGGAVILVPSSTRYRVAWATWLGRRGGWGCGSKVADATLVRLS